MAGTNKQTPARIGDVPVKIWIYRPDKGYKGIDLSLLYSGRRLTYWQEKELEEMQKQHILSNMPSKPMKQPHQVEVSW